MRGYLLHQSDEIGTFGIMQISQLFGDVPRGGSAAIIERPSSSNGASHNLVSSGWYITISPLLPDSMLCILSNLERITLLGAKIRISEKNTK